MNDAILMANCTPDCYFNVLSPPQLISICH